MNAQDKSLIYDFLNKADCLCSGHVLSDFSKVEFSDDIKNNPNEYAKYLNMKDPIQEILADWY